MIADTAISLLPAGDTIPAMDGKSLQNWLELRDVSQAQLARLIGLEPDKFNKSIKGTRRFTADESRMIDFFVERYDALSEANRQAFMTEFRRRYRDYAAKRQLGNVASHTTITATLAEEDQRYSKTDDALNSPDSNGRMIRLDEMNVSAMGGSGAVMDDHEEVKSRWVVPRDLISPVTDSPAERIKIITVTGDSMYPEFMAGMRVMVDTAHTQPSPPGVYIIWDGFALVLKRLEYLPDEEAPKVRLISANPDYPDRVEPLAAVSINGRVIGKWTWT